MTHKRRKNIRIFMFRSAGCSLSKAEGFVCNLEVLYGDLGIGKFKFLIQKKIRIGIQPKMMDPDPDPNQMNTDPKPCY
jgi:hypothetical protein